MTCPGCGTENREGRKFCSECGTALASACPSCGAANEPGEKFCGECGTGLVAETHTETRTMSPAPAAERRLVTVLFADLVGHTTFSEGRDAEDVRELLSRYFETARTVIERYGGTVEKFIGDAVMAVWGAPVAQEDDAERAVRAALDLLASISALGTEVGAPELRARAGVLTGEAAVTLGAEGQGMVAGDLVNTASRIQSVAEPGTVLVGETTKRAAEAAIVFEDAGSHTLKGKAEPVELWQAVRVISLLGGAARSTGLEPPFVGRDRELRLVKELYHATAEDRRSHLVSVVGIGGIGKSRLSWEFEKYVDGLVVLLTGPVPGLSEELRQRILDRAEGIPFYAVETVRMLLDRGVLVREGNAYRLTGEIGTLEVPETLHALLAARLDGLTTEERRIVQQASVLGRTFTIRGISTVSRLSEEELGPLLASLVRKEIVSLRADPLSPERGQYGFLQDLVKKVAYDTLSRKERKTLHLAAAEHLLSLGDEDEIVEVLASHYLDAYRAAPDDGDAGAIREQAREMLVRAAERAASLAADEEAQHAYERAIELADDLVVQAELHEQAGLMAQLGARPEEGGTHYEEAIARFNGAGETHAGARVEARLAEIMWDRGRAEEGLERMDRAYQALSQEDPDADLAQLAAQLGRFLFFAGRHEMAMQRIESALELAEALSLPETLSQALNTKAILLVSHGRMLEGQALLRYALEVALEHDKPSAALRAYFNLADSLSNADRYEEADATVREGLAYARRVGNRYQELLFLGQSYPLYALGKWDEVLEWAAEFPEDWTIARQAYSTVASICVTVNVQKGRLGEAQRWVELLADFGASNDAQERAAHATGHARLLLAQGDPSAALRIAQVSVDTGAEMGMTQEYVKEALVTALEAAIELRDIDQAEKLVAIIDRLPSGQPAQFLRAHALRFRAHVRALEGDDDAERLFKGAGGLFRELAMPFYLAVTELEHSEWLTAQSRNGDATPLAEEAREIFEQLGAEPWLERLTSIGGAAQVPA